ncbi:MAG: hypothetical protein AAF183_16040 [Pseudomonadota bacterium]
MAHWKQHRAANETQVAQHRVRFGQPLPPGPDTAPSVHGPPDQDSPILYGGMAALIGTGLFAILMPIAAASVSGLALGAIAWGVLSIARRGLRKREAREAAEARAIRDAETERQLAEMKAHVGQKEDGGDRTSR